MMGLAPSVDRAASIVRGKVLDVNVNRIESRRGLFMEALRATYERLSLKSGGPARTNGATNINPGKSLERDALGSQMAGSLTVTVVSLSGSEAICRLP